MSKHIKAWGEEKTVAAWLMDSRCHPSLHHATVSRRIRLGWDTVRAITAPPRPIDGSRVGRPRKAFGEYKKLSDWARDPRCVVGLNTLISRVGGRTQLGSKDLEEAITKPINLGIEAFGETKSVAAWARDDRCTVGYHTLYRRIRRSGWDPEDAITREKT